MRQVSRQEHKYLLPITDSLRQLATVSQIMQADPNNGLRGYRVRSLYFDTPEDTDFYSKVDGLELRRKLRLRIYSPSAAFALLELKQKEGGFQKKRSLKLKREDAKRLIDGRYSVLLQYQNDFAAECYLLLNEQGYRPKSVVEYTRCAYFAKENDIRITFDSEIRATEAHFDLFSKNLLFSPVLDPYHVVMEVKYNGFLLSYLKELLELSNRSTISVSKYGLSRRSLASSPW